MTREDVDCRDCPIGKAVLAGGCVGDEDCHLTTDTRRFINAMIRGVFDCGHCGKKTNYRSDEYVLCPHGVDYQYVEVGGFCHRFHERKEGEDG